MLSFRMKSQMVVFAAIFSLTSVGLLGITSTASADTFLPYGTTYGVGWFDTNKTISNTDDDLMCWAAATSNILTWGGWGTPTYSTEDAIFQHYQDHWSDQGGIMEYGWSWWIDGINPSQGSNLAVDDVDGWSQVDVPGGVPANGFWPQYSFDDYYHRTWQDDLAMSAIDNYLHAGYGTAIGIYTSGGGGHALTAWGYEYDGTSGAYIGLIFSDSDDYSSVDGSDRDLWLSSLTYSAGKWYLGGSSWYIGEVQALAVVPVPAAVLLGILGLGVAGWKLRKFA